MKKIFSLLLVFVMILSLCACGSGRQTSSGKSDWNLQQTVDEFGDVTEDSNTVIAGTFSGEFSNTATSNDELTVNVEFIKKEPFDHYMAKFDLKEYGNVNATYASGDSLTFKMKINDEITEYPLTGNAPNDSLYLGDGDYCWEGDVLFNTLYSGDDIRCIITIENSEYSFTLNSSNFTELCKENDFPAFSADMTAQEAVNIILEDKAVYTLLGQNWLEENFDKFESLSSDQMTELLNGYFVHIISAGTGSEKYYFPFWYIYNYSVKNGTGQAVSEYGFSYSNYNMDRVAAAVNQGQLIEGYKKYRRYGELPGIPLALSVENDIFTKTVIESNSKSMYQIKRITDNIFLTASKREDGTFEYSGLLIPSNGFSEDSIKNAILHATENDIPQIKN